MDLAWGIVWVWAATSWIWAPKPHWDLLHPEDPPCLASPSLWKLSLWSFWASQPKPPRNSEFPPPRLSQKTQPELCFSISQSQIPARSRFWGASLCSGQWGLSSSRISVRGRGAERCSRISGGRALAVPEFPRADGFFLADGILGWSRRRALPIPAGEESKGCRPREDPGGHIPTSRCSSLHLPRVPKTLCFGGDFACFYCPPHPHPGGSPRNPLESLPTPQIAFRGGGFQPCSASLPPLRKSPFVTPSTAGIIPEVFSSPPGAPPRHSSFFSPFVPGSTSAFCQKKPPGPGLSGLRSRQEGKTRPRGGGSAGPWKRRGAPGKGTGKAGKAPFFP